MSAIPGTVIGAPIVPTDTSDTYPTHYPTYGKGGIRTVANQAEMLAIKSGRLEEGMLVYRQDDQNTWRLKPGFSTPTILTDWEIAISPDPGLWAEDGTYLKPADGTPLYWNHTTNRLSIGSQVSSVTLDYFPSPISVGIGITSDVEPLVDSTFITNLGIAHADSAQIAPTIGAAKSRGTKAIPTTVQLGDIIAYISGLAYDGAGYLQASAINFAVDNVGTVSPTSMPSKISFQTTSDGGKASIERMVLNSQGNLTTYGDIYQEKYVDMGVPAQLFYRRARGIQSSPTAVQDIDNLGDIEFQGYDGTGFVPAARILATVNGTPGTNDMPAMLHFETTPDGGDNCIDRMTINAAGDVEMMYNLAVNGNGIIGGTTGGGTTNARLTIIGDATVTGYNDVFALTAPSYLSQSTSVAMAMAFEVPGVADGVGDIDGRAGIVISNSNPVSLGDQTANIAVLQTVRVEAVPFFSTTNTRTVTDEMTTVYIQGAPIAGVNVSFAGTPYALFVDDGISRFDSSVYLSSGSYSDLSLTFTGDNDTGFYQGGANSIRIQSGGDIVARFGELEITASIEQRLFSGTTPTILKVIGATQVNQVASTEAIDVHFDIARNVEFATGALATQRAVVIEAPTYAFVGASTLTNASTLAIEGAPNAGANATITNLYAFWVQSDNSRFGGAVLLDEITDPETSVNTGAIYTKDVTGSTELFYRYDSDGSVVQLTGGTGGGYWQRVGTVLSPATAGDTEEIASVSILPTIYNQDAVTVQMTTFIDPAVYVPIGAPGLDDMTSGGLYVGFPPQNFVIEIDGTPGMGFPDTYRWSRDGGSYWEASGVNIFVGPVTLFEGVTIEFASQFGHTIGDKWTFSSYGYQGATIRVKSVEGYDVWKIGGDGDYGLVGRFGSVGDHVSLLNAEIGQVGSVVSSGKQSSSNVDIYRGQISMADGPYEHCVVFSGSIDVGTGNTNLAAFAGNISSSGMNVMNQAGAYAANLSTSANDAAGSFLGGFVGTISRSNVLYAEVLIGPGYTVGETVTGSISGASATVDSIENTLTLHISSIVSGPFVKGDILTGSLSGSTSTLVKTQGVGGAITAVIAQLGEFTPGDGTYDYTVLGVEDDVKIATVKLFPGDGHSITLEGGNAVSGGGPQNGGDIDLMLGTESGGGTNGKVNIILPISTTIAQFSDTGLDLIDGDNSNPAYGFFTDADSGLFYDPVNSWVVMGKDGTAIQLWSSANSIFGGTVGLTDGGLFFADSTGTTFSRVTATGNLSFKIGTPEVLLLSATISEIYGGLQFTNDQTVSGNTAMINRENTGDLRLNAASGKSVLLSVNGTNVLALNSTTATLADKLVMSTAQTLTAANYEMVHTTNALEWNVPTSKTYIWNVNSVKVAELSATDLSLATTVEFTTAQTLTAAKYEMLRTADGIEWNVPTGKNYIFNVNDAASPLTITPTSIYAGSGVAFIAQDGTAAAPSYAFSIDLQTGLYATGLGTIAFSLANHKTFEYGNSAVTFHNPIVFGTNYALTGTDVAISRYGDDLWLNVPTGEKFIVSENGTAKVVYDGSSGKFGINTTTPDATLKIIQEAQTSGIPIGIYFVGGAHTGMTAGAQISDVVFGLNRTIGHWADSSIGNCPAVQILTPTHEFNSAQTIDRASTLEITDAPVEGSNCTITERYGLISKGEINAFGKSGTGARIRFLGEYTGGDPADPPQDMADAYILDDGFVIQFKVKYNKGGSIKTGFVTLA